MYRRIFTLMAVWAGCGFGRLMMLFSGFPLRLCLRKALIEYKQRPVKPFPCNTILPGHVLPCKSLKVWFTLAMRSRSQLVQNVSIISLTTC